uniref:Short transient receptor potential channel 7-like n=1 Tax=Saccoglossus kowalevskii TaxID=10224 RepID=A0ABM0GIH9_SACKO|nr:PREDICTED: short transient receptor potential channel 7-like [Saccoglossus kowalevskii]
MTTQSGVIDISVFGLQKKTNQVFCFPCSCIADGDEDHHAHVMRRRSFNHVNNIRVLTSTVELSDGNRKFLKAAEYGDLPSLRSLLEGDDSSDVNINCSDYKDRTAIEIAASNEHLEVVLYLLSYPTLEIRNIHEALMVAISKGYIRITEAILGHPMFKKSKDKVRLGSMSNYFQPEVHSSKFDNDVTPIMLAAHFNEIDIIQLFLQRGDRIPKPHHSLCHCTSCTNKRLFDPLKYSRSRINAYRGLSSSAYISLTSPDPILTAFQLSKDLIELSDIEKEFKNEYKTLANMCIDYSTDLIGMCQSTTEVESILNQNESMDYQSDMSNNNDQGLVRLKLAIDYNQKKFVAHPHCQHQLSTMWYSGIPNWRQRSPFTKTLIIFTLFLFWPIMGVIYWVAPKSKIGEIIASPMVKFFTQASSHIMFLILLFLQSLLTQYYHLEPDLEWLFGGKVRQNAMTALEIILLLWIVGILWGEMKQIWEEGFCQYFSSFWNLLDVGMLNLYIASFAVRNISYGKTSEAIDYFKNIGSVEDVPWNTSTARRHLYYYNHERIYWYTWDPILLSESLFALANVLSFTRMAYVLPASELLGPLQISLGRMVYDIVRFLVLFVVVFLAFFCALYNLYWAYANIPSSNQDKFDTFGSAVMTLFWALFGMASRYDPVIDESLDHDLTEFIGTLLFAIYNAIMVIVLLNMLIAMMSNSYQEIENDEDVVWKFARAKLWISFFGRGSTLPIPLNTIPSPKSIYYAFCYCTKFLCKQKEEKEFQHVNLSDRYNFQAIMRRLVKRYIFKLQRDKENDDISEGELEELKQDISSLRFELMEVLTHNRRSNKNITELGNHVDDSDTSRELVDLRRQIEALRRELSFALRVSHGDVHMV